MKANYAVMGKKTGVIFIEGTYKFCLKWMINNCHYLKKYDIYKKDNEQVGIVLL